MVLQAEDTVLHVRQINEDHFMVTYPPELQGANIHVPCWDRLGDKPGTVSKIVNKHNVVLTYIRELKYD